MPTYWRTHGSRKKDISSCKWLRRLVNQPLTDLRLVGARRVKPGFGQAVGVVVYPGWARNLVLPTKPFDRGGAEGGPPEDIGIRETIPEWGQSACLLQEDPLAVLNASVVTFPNQPFSVPLFWNGLLPKHLRVHPSQVRADPDRREERNHDRPCGMH